MKRLIFLALLFVAGCGDSGPSPKEIELLGECFAGVAYDVIAAEQAEPQPPAPAPKKCCGKCKNGLVLSGDGIAWVSCPCDDSCPCKQSKKAAQPKPCVSGTCRK